MQRHDTPRHDTPRFSAFTRFIYCRNDQEFLQCLQQAYHEFSIGNELDFTSLANAWLMDAKLPDDWRSLQHSAVITRCSSPRIAAATTTHKVLDKALDVADDG